MSEHNISQDTTKSTTRQLLWLFLGLALFGLSHCGGPGPLGFPCSSESECRALSCICGTCQPKGTTATCQANDAGASELANETTPDSQPSERTTPPHDTSNPPERRPPENRVTPDPTAPCQEGRVRPCYEGSPGTIGKGLCRAGSQRCTKGKWPPCSGQVIDKKEECNNKDDDCDGKIDEPFKEQQKLGQACKVQSGNCTGVGRYVCASPSSVVCKADKPSPNNTPEVCNNQDDDCDGVIDEYCGPAYSYAAIDASGRIAKQRNAEGKRTQDGQYLLIFKGYRCQTDLIPLFLTPFGQLLRAASYRCDNDDYIVTLSKEIVQTPSANDLKPTDGSFQAVLPLPKDNWALLVNTCTTKECKLIKSSIFKSTDFTGPTNSSQFSLKHPLCQPNRPVFATVMSGRPGLFPTATITTPGRCDFNVFDYSGKPVGGVTLGIWLPDHTKAAWATFGAEAKAITRPRGRQNYQQRTGDWAAKYTSHAGGPICPHAPGPLMQCNRFNITFPGWHTRPIALVGYYGTQGFGQAAFQIFGTRPNVTTFNNINGTVSPQAFTIMFVQ